MPAAPLHRRVSDLPSHHAGSPDRQKSRKPRMGSDRGFEVVVADFSQELSFSQPQSEISESVTIGSKRTRDYVASEENSTLVSGSKALDVCDPISATIARVKRLRISNNVADDKDGEARETLLAKKTEEPAMQVAAKKNLRTPEKPSLGGLPEELIIEILGELNLVDIMALRRTNNRLAHITRARILWITRSYVLLAHTRLQESCTTFLRSQLSTAALERISLRPHIFDYKWLRSTASHETPVSYEVLSRGWSRPKDIRCPILLPGGRWLFAVCDGGRYSNSNICLWNLDHDNMDRFPERQVVVEGRVYSMDVKMDQRGGFSFMAVLSEKENDAGVYVYQVDIYEVIFGTSDAALSFHQVDSLPLNGRRASEVQVYPEFRRAVVGLYDRVLIWEYAPNNMCAWMITSTIRHDQHRFSHKSAYAIMHTHRYILVADGDECVLRAFHLPQLLDRPVQLNALALHIPEPFLKLPLPSFAVSIRFSTDRSVDIPTARKTSRSLGPITNVHVNVAGAPLQYAHPGLIGHQREEDLQGLCSDPFGRGVLFVDAASCDSYLLYSFPMHEISSLANSANGFILTCKDRRDAHEQARSGLATPLSGMLGAAARPYLAPVQMGGKHKGGRADALWVGSLGGVSSILMNASDQARRGLQNVALVRSPDYDGGLMVLSSTVPPAVDLDLGQSRIVDVEQGSAKTVLLASPGGNGDSEFTRTVRVEEASVDQISGRVCVVETTTLTDKGGYQSKIRYGLRLLEYALP